MRFTGLKTKSGKDIYEGMHLLLKFPPYNGENIDTPMIYASNLGKQAKALGATYFVIYVEPNKYISLDIISAMLKKDGIPFTVAEINTVKDEDEPLKNVEDDSIYDLPYSRNVYDFMKYLIAKGIEIDEEPTFNLKSNTLTRSKK